MPVTWAVSPAWCFIHVHYTCTHHPNCPWSALAWVSGEISTVCKQRSTIQFMLLCISLISAYNSSLTISLVVWLKIIETTVNLLPKNHGEKTEKMTDSSSDGVEGFENERLEETVQHGKAWNRNNLMNCLFNLVNLVNFVNLVNLVHLSNFPSWGFYSAISILTMLCQLHSGF